MRKKMQWQWEILDEFTKRAQVIGGWLVEYGSHSNKGAVSNSLAFVPDRDHEWHIMLPIQPEAPKATVQAADFEPK